ncbi:MAG: AAA family ATPase [Planctomycetota bacterium]
MYRFALENLKDWARQDRRKPIVLRGARQVGKSYLVRLLAQECFESLVEVNFEQRPDMASLFESMERKRSSPCSSCAWEAPLYQAKHSCSWMKYRLHRKCWPVCGISMKKHLACM